MRLPHLALMAVIWLPPVDEAGSQSACRITIEIAFQAVAADPAFDERALREEVERLWAPYGVDVCWRGETAPCREAVGRLSVRLEASIDSTASDESDTTPIVGQIRLRPGGGDAQVRLSLAGARSLAARARLGGRPLGSLPSNLRDGFLSRVLGRGLAHEVGHFVLASRDHSTRGLMTPAFRPDLVTLAPASRLSLTSDERRAVWSACVRSNAQALVRRLEAR
jgi:hypothetical protein